MRSIGVAATWLALLFGQAVNCELNVTDQISRQILPSSFVPPQVFRHTNLVRTVSLTKSYAKETVNAVVENTVETPQSEYYLPFEADVIARVGSLEVKDKNNAKTVFAAPEVVEYDTESATQYYKITLPTPLAKDEKITLSITFYVLSVLNPLPEKIEQTEKQYVQYKFSAYAASAYDTIKQKTVLKLPTPDIPDFTKLDNTDEGNADPQKQGNTLTYGVYSDIPAGVQQSVAVRYEFTKPLLHVSVLERDVEVSHWGGNLATEERYLLSNRGATLKKNFDRVTHQQSQYYSPASSAAKQLNVPLAIGSMDPYFTDDIGNVSTSRFRSNLREATLELKPRYPIFGGWKYKFRIGWNGDLKQSLRKLTTGDTYVLKVPFVEGPKDPEGIEYEKVVLSVILPEGATDVKFETTAQIISSEQTLHRTFMDTLGRTTLRLTALNVVDEARDRYVVVTYDYPALAGFRKPIVLFASFFAIFVAAWTVANLDVSIGKKQR